jgi:WD40 repeat protein
MPRLRTSLLLLVLAAPAWAEPPDDAKRRTDQYGDPLPEGAVLRLGTTRLRHGSWVFCAAFSPDSRTLASGGDDRALRLWDVATGREIWRYCAQDGGIHAVAFSANGKMIASGSADRTIHILDAATGKAIARLQGNSRVTSLAFSPDSNVLAAATGYGGELTITLWHVASGNELRRLKEKNPKGSDYQIAFAPDGKTLASTRAGTFEISSTLLWDVATGKVLHDLTNKQSTSSIAFSPDCKTLALGSADSIVHLWDVATGREVRQFRGHATERYRDGVNGVAFAPDGKTLVSGGGDHTIRLWDVETGKQIRQFEKDTDRIKFVAFAPDGRTVASIGAGNRVRLWDFATGKQTCLFDGHQDALTCLAFSPIGGKLITGDVDGAVRIWDTDTGRKLWRFQEHDDDIRALAVSPNGQILASSGSGEVMRLRDLNTGAEILRIPTDDAIYSLAFSPDGKNLSSGSPRDMRLWNVATGKELNRFEGCSVLAFSGDGRVFATASTNVEQGPPGVNEWTIHFREMPSGKITRQSGGYDWGFIRSIAFSPDGQFLASGGRDQSIHFWEVSTGKELFSLEKVQKDVTVMAFSPDGKVLASADDEGVVYFWEVSTRKVRRRLRGHQGEISSLAFSPEGKTLATGSFDTTSLIWDLTRPIQDGPLKPGRRSKAELERLWTDLASDDAGKADDALRELMAAPDAVAFIKGRLNPVSVSVDGRVAQLISQLDDDRYAERQKVAKELASLQGVAEPALHKALAGQLSPEARRLAEGLLSKLQGPITSGETLRSLRAIEVLEHIATVEARQLIKKVAEGFFDARLTREAKAALERLEKRRGK